jgi:hypothetical protein
VQALRQRSENVDKYEYRKLIANETLGNGAISLESCGNANGKFILHKVKVSLCLINHLKTEFLPNNVYKFCPYLTGYTFRLYYKAQPVNAVWGNSRCLL